MSKRWTLLAMLLLSAPAAPQTVDRAAAERRADAIVARMTPEEKIELIGGVHDFYTRAIPRLRVPALKMSDGPLGVHDYGLTTAYAAPICLAASWNPELARRFGESMGKDARSFGVHIVLAPGMNIYRAPMNGRNFEYLGEDPFLSARMASSTVEGIQSQGVMACAKHFAANNEEYGRMDHSSDVDERTLREIYLPAFEACVKEAHVGSIMDAYNLVNGVYCTENSHLNTEIAKGEWGFEGIIMSDWGATHNGLAAANGGLDLEMPSAAFMNAKTLLPALQDGQLKMAVLDDKVRRILRTAIRFGFFDRAQLEPDQPSYSQLGREVSLETAREGMVLLKNAREGSTGVLPFDRKRVKTILVIGPNAYPAVPGGGGSSETKPFHAVSELEGIGDAGGLGVHVVYARESADLDAVVNNTVWDGGSLKGEYFDNVDLAGHPALVRGDRQVNFQFGEGSYRPDGPVDNFSARWRGTFTPAQSDDYTFYVSADDGIRLYVNDQRVLNDWQPHGETLDKATVHLQAGKPAKIRLEYFELAGTATVRFGVSGSQQPLTAALREEVARADAVVACMGFSPSTEGEGSDRSFRLPPGQEGLIHELSALNKKVVVVLNAGGNVDMQGWLGGVAGLVQAWYPGQEGGTALGQLLFGDANFSGKLPATFERRWSDNPAASSYYPRADHPKHVRYAEGIFVGYRGYEKNHVQPQFPFGYGLSYTSFRYGALKVDGTTNGARVSFTVQNTGSMAGAEVAQVYVGEEAPKVPRPAKELKGFVRVSLRPGQSRRVSVRLDRRAFAYWDTTRHGWTVDAAPFSILVGASSQDIRLKGTL